MAIIIVSQNNIEGGGSASEHSHNNLDLLNKLKIDNNGNLMLNNVVIGEKSIEIIYEKNLTQQDIINGYFELPEDCDTDRAITLIFCNIPQIIKDDWEVIIKDPPEKDRVAWKGLNMEQIVEVGDKVSMTYYKKNN